jgi:hypothetical protein
MKLNNARNGRRRQPVIDIPIGKALAAVEVQGEELNGRCQKCLFDCFRPCRFFPCNRIVRKDGKNVVFKLVDYPAKEDL